MRILILTRSYPQANDLYQYPFVHRRVLAYRAAGHDVAVFRPTSSEPQSHEFEGVTCRSGDSDSLVAFAASWKPDVVAAHGLSEAMWPAVAALDGIPVRAWLHGSEIPAFFKARGAKHEDVEARATFWRKLLQDVPPRLKLAFPSRSAVELMREHCDLHERDYQVIPNPIDTNLFACAPKRAEDRLSILSVRPYECRTRANELAVAAVLHLSTMPAFERLRFTFIGDGPLFEQTLAPISNLPNVRIRREFLTQANITGEHKRHGVFLVPTRLDTQGVSRDEAMSSGLVPVTNAIPVVREFVDQETAGLAAPDDSLGLADEIWRMVEDPDLYLRRSAAAAERVRRERGHGKIIPMELTLLAEALVYA